MRADASSVLDERYRDSTRQTDGGRDSEFHDKIRKDHLEVTSKPVMRAHTSDQDSKIFPRESAEKNLLSAIKTWKRKGLISNSCSDLFPRRTQWTFLSGWELVFA